MKKIILSIILKLDTDQENTLLDTECTEFPYKKTQDSKTHPEILFIDYSIPHKKDKWDMVISLLSGLTLGYSWDMIKTITV